MPVDLAYRIAESADLPLLLDYRRQCGWGEKALLDQWDNPDRVYCVFSLVSTEDEEKREDIGMGCWYLHQPDDVELACHDENIVHLASLYIAESHQNQGLGRKALDILERVAVERFAAKIVTLDTTAYHMYWSEDRSYRLEDKTKTGRNVMWYKTRGYVPFRDNRPLYHHPTPDDPDRLLIAAFLKKSAEAISRDIAAAGGRVSAQRA